MHLLLLVVNDSPACYYSSLLPWSGRGDTCLTTAARSVYLLSKEVNELAVLCDWSISVLSNEEIKFLLAVS